VTRWQIAKEFLAGVLLAALCYAAWVAMWAWQAGAVGR
jgi:hypothetical protein